MRKIKTLGAALLVASILVMGIDYVSYAATGDALILGKINKAHGVTTVTRTTNGPVLKLNAKNNSAAPLVTNGHGKVTNLNADRVDGKHASAFAPAAHAPRAVGFINTDGSLGHSWGIASSTYNGTYYVITLHNTNFFYSNFAVNVTPTCANYEAKYDSSGGNLLVEITNDSTTATQCSFAVTVFTLT